MKRVSLPQNAKHVKLYYVIDCCGYLCGCDRLCKSSSLFYLSVSNLSGPYNQGSQVQLMLV